MNTTMDTRSQSQKVVEEVGKLTSRVDTLAKVATSASIAGVGIGALAAISVGPLAFLVGASVGAIVSLAVKSYAITRKKEITNEVIDLKSRLILSEKEADKLKNEIRLIYTDAPK